MNKKVFLAIIISVLVFILPMYSYADDFIVGQANIYIGESYKTKDIVLKFIEEDYDNLIVTKDPLNYYFEMKNDELKPYFSGEGLLMIYKKDDSSYTKLIKLHTKSKIKDISLKNDKINGNSGDIIDLPIEITVYEDVDNYKESDLRIISRNSEIASVLEGFKIRLKASGSTVISLTNSDGSIKKSLSVTSRAISRSVIIADKASNGDVLVGEVKNLKALHNGKDSPELIVWESSNPYVASIDSNGKLKGLTTGKSTITALSSDKRNRDSYEVNVFTNIKGISVDDDSVILKKIGDTKKIEAKINYRDMEISSIIDGYHFVSDKESVVSVTEDGLIEAMSQGTARVSVRSNDGSAVDYVDVYVNLTEDVDPLEAIVDIKTVKIIDKAESIIVGEKLQIKTDYSPTNATVVDLNYSVSNSDIGSIIEEDGLYYYIASKTGMNQIIVEAPSGARSVLNLNAKSYLGSIKFKMMDLESSSAGNYTMYLGQSTILDFDFLPRRGVNNQIVYNTGVDYISVDTNLSVDRIDNSLKAVKEGTGKVIVKSIDGGFTDTLNLDVVSAFSGLSTNLKTEYNVGETEFIVSKATIKSKAPKDIKINTVSKVHKQYLRKEYVVNEIKHEERFLKYLNSTRKINDAIRLSLISISNDRLDILKEILKLESGGYCELSNSNRLRTREGNIVELVDIDGDSVRFLKAGKVTITTSEVGSRLHKIDDIYIK